MASDSSDGPREAAAQASPGGALLLLFACLPYALLVAALPDAGDFPNEGGGEARIGRGIQELWAYVACVATMGLLWLALWRGSRSGGIAEWARRTIPFLVPAAGFAMVVAIAQTFDQPGPLLPLVPIMLPPVIGAYALWGCLPALTGWLPRAKIDGAALGLIAALSLAVIPLGILDSATWPRRLERHHAELAASDAASKMAGEQREQELRAKFARLGPESSLRDYLEARQWYLSDLDILGGARQVKSRQNDAVAMLNEGMVLDLSDLWQLDLQPTPTLCQAYGHALAATLGRSEIYRGSAYLSLMDGQFPNIRWLREGGCDLGAAVAEIDAQLAWMLDSKDPSGAAANDYAAYFSRFGVSRENVEAERVKLKEFR